MKRSIPSRGVGHAAAAFAAAVLVLSCSDHRLPSDVGSAWLADSAATYPAFSRHIKLSSITVAPDPDTLAAGNTQTFTAVGHDRNGGSVTINPAWSVVAGGGAISSSGQFTAGAAVGTYINTIRASVGGVSGRATVTVLPSPVATITVTPTPDTLHAGGTQQFTAVGRDSAGNVVAITPTWSVAAGGGAISSAGLFTAGSTVGTYPNTVRATSGVASGTATVTVLAGALAIIAVTPSPDTLRAGGTQQFTAVGRDSAGNAVAITPTWSVAAGGGAISSAGLFTAGSTPGTYANTIRATSGAISATATVTVLAGALATIAVTPTPDTLHAGGTQQFTAVGRDSAGNAVAITPTWSVAAGGGTISSAGLFTAGSTLGTYPNTIHATSGSVTGTATVTVLAGALATIAVTPSPDTLHVGGTQQFTAVGRDAGGNVLTVTPTWSVAAGGGTISTAGMFTAGSVSGTYANTVRATSGSISGSASVAVLPGPISPATSVIGVSSSSIVVGGTATLTLQGKDAAGNNVTTGGAVVVFSASGGTSTGTVGSTKDNGNGTYTASFTGVGAGTATSIHATIGGVAVTTTSPTVTVTAPATDGEPSYNSTTGTLIYTDSMEGYTSAAAMWNATGAGMRIRQGFSVDTPASQVISPGYGGTGKALRVTYAGTYQEGHDWDLLNAPYLPDTTTHFFQYYARVTMSAPLTSTLAFKWFMVFHPAGDRNQWNTHDHLPCPLQASPDPHTYWQDYDVSKLTYCQANQPIGPYPGQVFDGQWHRFTYEYRPNTSAGSRDGISRMWVDGTKIIDISLSAVGVTPPGGYKPWCGYDDLDALYTQGINLVRWFSTLTTTVPSFIVDIDNFIWWVKK